MIQIEYGRDNLLDEHAIATLKDRYLLEGETSPQDAFARAAIAFSDDEAMAQRIYDYVSKQWLSLATPVLSNAPVREKWGESFETNFTKDCFSVSRGLPISCFLNYVGDSRKELGEHYIENIWLGSLGGGIGGFWGHIRSDGTTTSSGSKSTGSIPFLKIVDSEILAVSQGVTRRGSYAAWYDDTHPELLEFLDMRRPTGGDPNRKALNLHQGISLSDKFMRIIDEASHNPDTDTSWELYDPHSGEVRAVVDARELWEKIVQTRAETGEPFIMFKDTVNAAFPEALKKAGLMVHHSNLCSEIMLGTDSERTAVCCLSSPNIEMYDYWKHDALFIEDCIRMLDNVLQVFIESAPEDLWRAVKSAEEERSLGLGALGFHYYLMSKNVPFESAMASAINRQIFKDLHDKAKEATYKLAIERGEPKLLEGTGRRNAHLIAIAPNASSSIVLGTSPSIEPVSANIFTHKTMSGSWTVRNKYLDDIIWNRFPDTRDRVWKEVLANGGSISGIEGFTDQEREVFKTAFEIDQFWLMDHAAVRQPNVCQSQSLNLFFEPDAPVSYVHHILLQGWKRGVKSFYYHRTKARRRAENVGTKVERQYLINESECMSCEG